MKNQLLVFLTCCGLVTMFSCENTPKAPATPKPVTVSSSKFNKKDGKDCEKADTLQVDCATIDLSWPKVEDGTEALKKSVKEWAENYVTGIIAPYDSVGTPLKSNSIELAADMFFKTRQDYMKEAPDSPGMAWIAESSDTVLLNDGQFLTLQINSYSFEGGAHGSPLAAVATFNDSTGVQLNWNDLVTDTTALKALAEKKFREERADIFQPTDGSEPFQFDDVFQFKLPDNYGLVADGILCYYLVYEVGPYAFGETTFTIPFAELGALSKIKK